MQSCVVYDLKNDYAKACGPNNSGSDCAQKARNIKDMEAEGVPTHQVYNPFTGEDKPKAKVQKKEPHKYKYVEVILNCESFSFEKTKSFLKNRKIFVVVKQKSPRTDVADFTYADENNTIDVDAVLNLPFQLRLSFKSSMDPFFEKEIVKLKNELTISCVEEGSNE